MNTKYAIHPADYAIGEIEQFYSSMARKGWILQKRCTLFSKFKRGDKQELLYRVDLSRPSALEADGDLPEELLELYSGSGWSFVTRRRLVNVFCASASSNPPELYTDTASQAETLTALRRQYRWEIIGFLVIAAIYIALWLGVSYYDDQRMWVDARMTMVHNTAYLLALLTLLTGQTLEMLYAGLNVRRLYKRMAQGHPLRISPRRSKLHSTAIVCYICLLAALLGLALWQVVGTYKGDDPTALEGPQLLISDFGITGEHVGDMGGISRNRITRRTSLAAEIWDVFETVEQSQTQLWWLSQTIYMPRNSDYAMRLATDLLHASTFAQFVQYLPVNIEGLEAAWEAPLECVAVKDGMVYYITTTDIPMDVVLEKLAGIQQ